jgi:bacterioferritin-associated ferredoxin
LNQSRHGLGLGKGCGQCHRIAATAIFVSR